MGKFRRLLIIVLTIFFVYGCHGDKRTLVNLADILANNANIKDITSDKASTNSNPQGSNSPMGDTAVTSIKPEQFGELSSLLSAIKSAGGEQTINPSIAALLATHKPLNTGLGEQIVNPSIAAILAAQKAQIKANTDNVETTNSVESANTVDNANNANNAETAKNSNIDMANLAALLGGQEQSTQKPDISSLFSGKTVSEGGSSNTGNNDDEIKVPIGDGIMDIKDINTGKRHTHFTLQRGVDGSLMLLPITEEKGDSRGISFGGAELNSKNGPSVTGSNRQQLQVSTLAQAIYSPFPGDQNILHLHLKGKDGKDGKLGTKGSYGPPGAAGPAGPKGPKGDQGTCLAQVKKEPYGCTPDELDSLSSRVDYLEKICKKTAPIGVKPTPKPIGPDGGGGNPVPSCQAIYEKNPDAKSGAYWLMVNGVRFKTWCEFIKGGGDSEEKRPALAGGWTLVARIKGQANDWSPVSENWASNNTLNENSAYDMTVTTSMKNMGYSLVKSNVLLLCFTGKNTGCAPFTHGRNMPLANLFATQFGVVPDEQYTFATLMKAFGKSCDLSILRQSWCGLNLANVCDPKNADPNEKPVKTTHIARIGCVGDRTATCFPDDYAVGIGATSCKDGFGCSNVGPSRNMHYRCDYVYGAFSQTAYLYVL